MQHLIFYTFSAFLIITMNANMSRITYDWLFWISRCKHWWCWQLHLRQGAQHGGSALIFSLWEAQLHYNNSHYQYLTHSHTPLALSRITCSSLDLSAEKWRHKPSAPTAPLTVTWALLIAPLDGPLPQLSTTRGKFKLRDTHALVNMIMSWVI